MMLHQAKVLTDAFENEAHFHRAFLVMAQALVDLALRLLWFHPLQYRIRLLQVRCIMDNDRVNETMKEYNAYETHALHYMACDVRGLSCGIHQGRLRMHENVCIPWIQFSHCHWGFWRLILFVLEAFPSQRCRPLMRFPSRRDIASICIQWPGSASLE